MRASESALAMGIASIILGVLSMIFAVAGFLLSWVPVLGALLSFGAPILALIGIVLGGVGMSRAKEEGSETGIPMAGLIVSIICFFPALLVALTCGVCNTVCTTASLNARRRPPITGTPWYIDAGSGASPGLGPQPVPPAPVPPPVQPQAPQPPQLPAPTLPDPAALNPNPIPGGPPPGFAPPPDQTP